MLKKLVVALSGGLLAALLPACDAINLKELKPGVSTGYEVRDRMGAPSMEWQEKDGSRIWEYARTPEGTNNYMLVIGPDNVLREIRQVLTPANFAKVQPGMHQEDIRRLLGKPAQIIPFPLKKEVVWDWKTQSENNRETFFNVHFDEAGVVTGTSTSVTGSPG